MTDRTSAPNSPQRAFEAVETLRERLADIDADRDQRVAAGLSAADEDLNSAISSLHVVLLLCEHQSFLSKAIGRLYVELLNIGSGAGRSAMLEPRIKKGARPDGALVMEFKGRVAALAEFIQHEEAISRPEANKRALSLLPLSAASLLKDPKWKTVNDWRIRYGDTHSPESIGRTGYESMMFVLQHRPGDAVIRKLFAALADFGAKAESLAG